MDTDASLLTSNVLFLFFLLISNPNPNMQSGVNQALAAVGISKTGSGACQ